MKKILMRCAGAVLALSAFAAGAVATPVRAADAMAVPCQPPCEVSTGNREDVPEHARIARFYAYTSAPVGTPIVITFRVVHRTTDDSDLVPTPQGTVTIPVGATRAEIVVNLYDDNRCEPTEWFVFQFGTTGVLHHRAYG